MTVKEMREAVKALAEAEKNNPRLRDGFYDIPIHPDSVLGREYKILGFPVVLNFDLPQSKITIGDFLTTYGPQEIDSEAVCPECLSYVCECD